MSPILSLLLLLSGCGSGSDSGSDSGADSGSDGGSNPGTVQPVDREVTIDVGELILEGTLSVPAHSEGQRLPGIVLVHGTGPQGRDEVVRGQQGLSFSFEYPAFTELSDLLVGRGYAVLRYDKRSCIPPRCANSYPSPSHEPTVDYFISDAAAVLSFMAAQPEVDAARVAVAGHSQGGALIPAILTASPGTAVGVALAGPWGVLDVVARWQATEQVVRMRRAGATQAEIDADTELAELFALADALTALRTGQPWTGAPFGSENFWRTWIDMDLARPGLAAAVGRPMIAISGDYDWNVGTEETLAWEQAGVATAVILPGITHVFNYVSEPDYVKLKQSDIGQGVDPSVSNAIADYLDREMP